MSEPKPVAWASIPDKITGHSYIKLGKDNPNEKIYTVPLFTKAHVKMTSKEFDEWKILYNSCDRYDYNVFGMLGELIENSRLAYCSLAVKFEQEKGQADLARLYVNYDPENPEETIEIV